MPELITAELTNAEKSVTAESTTALSWLQKHERIVITFLALCTTVTLGDKYLNVQAAKDKQQAVLAEQKLDAQKAADVVLATQVSQISTQYQALQSQLSAQTAQLTAAMANRTVVLQQQVASDKTLTLPDLGARWSKITGISQPDITATPTGIQVTDSGARQTVELLEQVPVLTSDLKSETDIANYKQAELNSANELITGLKTQVTNLNTTVNDQQAACAASLKSAKADANKAKSKWFKVGFVGGVVAGFFVGHKF